MNSFISVLDKHKLPPPVRVDIQTLQVNLGSLCNMTCEHCHVNAGPASLEIMSQETADSIIRFLFKHRIQTLDITGGAPEMAPPFKNLVTRANQLVKEIMVRCNLTVLFEPGMDDLPDFYVGNNIHLVCSLPCYTKENVDKQRGTGTFDSSIEALKILNSVGYGQNSDLKLDLVYNPGGAFLPANQAKLEADYKKALKDNHNISFNKLITITNMPISRFSKEIKKNTTEENYLRLLANNFNPSALESVMCKYLLSVAWDGKIYDCDFNQALGIETADRKGNSISIENIDLEQLLGGTIRCADHCLGCVAGEGSSCSGALI
ncbi:MAG: arsenosugar biosynthesis radical SAM protein ArsS [Deltaproteobacteria bacterium]|nr:arsenosugar biosynthesis radical SAM protein ArsS [Deltaproteobacteria bacterium]